MLLRDLREDDFPMATFGKYFAIERVMTPPSKGTMGTMHTRIIELSLENIPLYYYIEKTNKMPTIALKSPTVLSDKKRLKNKKIRRLL